MSNRHTIARLSIASVLAIIGLTVSMTTFAQESSHSSSSATSSTEYTQTSSSEAPAGFGTIIIDQRNGSEIGSIGTWTLIGPNNSSGSANLATQTIANTPAGNYTLFIVPPNGVMTTIRSYHGSDQVSLVQRPQISFKLTDGETLKLIVNYTLNRTGVVSIQSDPAGLTFKLKGPDGWEQEGTAPDSFEGVPVGQYSLQFGTLEGCTLPAPKSQQLAENSRISFGITLVCKAADKLRSRAETKSDKFVVINVDGTEVQLKDVPQSAWFSTYVYESARRNVLSGYKDAAGVPTGEFGPGNSVTIAELAKISHRLGSIGEESFIGKNPDNPAALGQWFSPFIASAEARGWTLYKDATVDPLRTATRAEVIVTFLQVLDIPLEWQKGDLFGDVSVRTRYANAIETAARDGVVEGLKDEKGKALNKFNPEGSINRAELSKIINSVFEVYKGGKNAAPQRSR
jgi:hypothetical protein